MTAPISGTLVDNVPALNDDDGTISKKAVVDTNDLVISMVICVDADESSVNTFSSSIHQMLEDINKADDKWRATFWKETAGFYHVWHSIIGWIW